MPDWIAGLAFGDRDIFPVRVLSYPYDSIESVVRHEVVHLALNARAGRGELPRWFHEGVATSVDAGGSDDAGSGMKRIRSLVRSRRIGTQSMR